jgi:hypothetical protein
MDTGKDSLTPKTSQKSLANSKASNANYDPIQGIELLHTIQCEHLVKSAKWLQIGERLKARGILPWLDEWELQPGLPWQRLLETQIESIKSAAVFIGSSGFGPWQNLELEAFLRQFVKRGLPVIPVLLTECQQVPNLPPFLDGMTWVDFRESDPDPLDQFIWGITGQRKTRG